MEKRITFKVRPEERCVYAEPEETTLEALIKHKLPLDHSCGGNGTCGTCLVIIEEGLEKLKPPEELELEMAQDRGFQQHERLACQLVPVSGMVIRLPD